MWHNWCIEYQIGSIFIKFILFCNIFAKGANILIFHICSDRAVNFIIFVQYLDMCSNNKNEQANWESIAKIINYKPYLSLTYYSKVQCRRSSSTTVWPIFRFFWKPSEGNKRKVIWRKPTQCADVSIDIKCLPLSFVSHIQIYKQNYKHNFSKRIRARYCHTSGVIILHLNMLTPTHSNRIKIRTLTTN